MARARLQVWLGRSLSRRHARVPNSQRLATLGEELRPFDSSGQYHPPESGDPITRQALRGAGATVASGGVAQCIQIIGTIVLARLLTPQDFGLVAMVTTFSQFLMNFGLNGFTESVLQREKINHSLVSNLFWINLGAGFALTCGFAAAGSLLARFYHDPLVAHVALALSLTIILTSVSVLHLALLQRAMRFTAVSATAVIARAASLAAAIVLAWVGWGYWALVVGAIALPLVQSVEAFCLCPWLPGPPRRAAGTASMVRFALSVYGRFSLGFFSQNVDNLLVGWRFGAPALGFYKKAYDLFALAGCRLTAPLTNVAVAALSRIEADSAEYRRHILGALALIAFVGMGLGGDLTLVGKDVIRLLLGPQWSESGQIFVFFGPGIGVMVLYYSTGWLHLSLGRADRWLRWAVVEVIVTCLLFLLGLHWGARGVAAAWTASFWILIVPAFAYAGKPAKISVTPMIAAVWRYFAAALVAGCATAVIIRSLSQLLAGSDIITVLARIVTTSALFGTLYVVAVVVLHGDWSPLLQLVTTVRKASPRHYTPESKPFDAAITTRHQPIGKDGRVQVELVDPEVADVTRVPKL